ncbi:MAG: hypothetical protein V2I43_05700 [Parvularcula sp.]|jgi:hypothetical protein|nr:hypothetical protein [Parvularcula sp.]
MKVIKNFFLGIGVLFTILVVIAIMTPVQQPTRGQVLVGVTDASTSQCRHPGTPPAGSFGAADVEAISEASRGNEARFDRDYRARTFYDCMFFHSLERKVLGEGWDLRMADTQSAWMPDVTCSLNDRAAGALVNVNRGEIIHVRGTIDTTVIGTVLLKNCTIN